MSRAAPGHRRGLHLQDDAIGGRGGYGWYVRTTSPRAPLTKRMGPKHWAALDYLAGGFTALVLLLEVRRGLAAGNFPQTFGVVRYWPMPLTGPVDRKSTRLNSSHVRTS